MKCGVCGANFTKSGANRFGCTGARDRGTCDNHLTVRADEIEASILDGLKSRLMAPDLFEEFAREFLAEVNRQRASASAEHGANRRELDRATRQIGRLVDAIANGADARALQSKLKNLESEQERLTAELASHDCPQTLIHPNLALVDRQKVERLGGALHDAQHGREAFELVRSLISEVRLVPADGTLLLELEGDLAGIVAISESAKPGQEPGAKALQIKMVAGVGFEPTTFRL
jgi:site-specific DNA recombinase